MWSFKKKKNTLQEELVKKIKEEHLDLDGLFSNINNRSRIESLYKELCKLCHPDLYEKEPDKRELAQDLFTKIQKGKNDYNALLKLKEEIIDSLMNK
jgi:hypothetical protein